MASKADPSTLEGEDTENYEETVEEAVNEILDDENYEDAYELLAEETDRERGVGKGFRNPYILLNQLAKESSVGQVPEYLSALAQDDETVYRLEEAEEKVKSFAEELKDQYID